MRRSCVFACVVAIGLATSVNVEARRGGLNVLKQRGAALLSRWQQRVLPQTDTWMQLGLAVALCTTLACGGVTQSPEVTESNAPAVSAAPDVQQDDAMLIITKLYGKGFSAARGIPPDSIAAYENSKTQLPVQFYDGMMIHYVEDGKDFVRVVDLVDDSVLKVRLIGDLEVLVDFKTIAGVMVGEHYEYGGRRHISVAADLVRPINNDGGDQLLEAMPEGVTFYGVPNLIFSNGIYVVNIIGFSLPSGQMNKFPAVLRFIASAEDLVTITRPTQPPTPPQRKRQFRPGRKKNEILASYRVDDDGLVSSLLSGTDNGVFSSK